EAKTLLLEVEKHPKTPPPVKRKIPGLRATIDAELAKRVGSLSVKTGNLEGATVLVDGTVIGLTPLERALKPGTYQLAVRASGYRPHVETLKIEPDAKIRREIQLVALPVLVQINTPGVTGAMIELDGARIGVAPQALRKLPGRYRVRITKIGYKVYEETILVTLATPLTKDIELEIDRPLVIGPKPSPPRGDGLAIGGYVSGGLGLVLLGVAGAFHGLAVKDRDASARLSQSVDEARESYNSSKTKIKVAYALYGIGGASLITGVVLLALHYSGGTRHGDRRKPGRTERWRVLPTIGGGSLEWRF
ncbi:MAG: PEGA domain-containing protein, partial [Myxococcales bacterium]|nr:PEGA domain-containing protein [Myxococcales bacterium]